jgi:hypothetical protein
VNIEETKKAIEVMQAFVDGKTVQCSEPEGEAGYGWRAEKEPLWQWDNFRYRVKPEPKEIWVNEYSDGRKYSYDCRDNAISGAGKTPSRKAVRYREVIEE